MAYYNIKLKCYVVIELKIGEFRPEYAGQLSFYLTAIDEQIKEVNDNPTIGLILCSRTSEDMARYSMLKDNDRLFQAKYLTFLPTKEELSNKNNKNYIREKEKIL